MTQSIAIEPIESFTATIRPPGSKSLSNRAMLLAALAEGESTLTHLLLSDDTRHMIAALKDLGFELQLDEPGNQLRLIGRSGIIPSQQCRLHLGNAGTALRPLTAALCLSKTGTYQIDGEPRMRQRPIGELVDALRLMGAQITYGANEGYPPLHVTGNGLAGGQVTLGTTQSSQFITSLLMIGPYCEHDFFLRFDGDITSRSYVEMTISLMKIFGVDLECDQRLDEIKVPTSRYQAVTYDIEPDASSASYFLAAAAIIPSSRCTIQGLGKNSLQGDVGFADVLHQMGAGLLFGPDFITVMAPSGGQSLHGIDIDMNHMPDMAQTLAVVALFAQGPTIIRNVGNLRVKETDRMVALQIELTKLGANIVIDGDMIRIDPPVGNKIKPAAIDTYDDHRMAMSCAIAGLRSPEPGVIINDPTCVNKTFPGFFGYLDRLRNQ
ncbi:MAG: 3-phosphoshikimate 1-carboxyvinyltransferase [Phycisphaeraceae bacterium]|nr:3-phosphoshikimate 1-carboxyvinyltransferase [Phycisphaeraceae bacterium]